MNHRKHTAAAIIAIALAAVWITAGPLNPPPGPITPTLKPLAEIEPRIPINATTTPGDATALFRITQPGSYYLTGNITGAVDKHGIEIRTSNVTLDLSGFALIGVAGSLDGINISANRGRNITIRNGAVRGWGDCGVQSEQNLGNPPTVHLSGIRAALNGRDGIELWGGSQVIDCTAEENTGNGINSIGAVLIRGCVADANGLDGIRINGGGVIAECTATANTGDGIALEQGGTASNCTASFNNIGFAGSGGTFTGCNAYLNDADGFDVSFATITGSTAYSNRADGIDAGSGSTVADCTAYNNSGNGITVSSGSTVHRCTARQNDVNGIQAGTGCVVIENLLTSNGQGANPGAGIRTTGADNRVEGNNCTGQDVGIQIDGSGSVITRNTCSGNTANWDVAPNNIYGALIDRRIPSPILNTPGISGTSAAGTLGTTDPHANFTY